MEVSKNIIHIIVNYLFHTTLITLLIDFLPTPPPPPDLSISHAVFTIVLSLCKAFGQRIGFNPWINGHAFDKEWPKSWSLHTLNVAINVSCTSSQFIAEKFLDLLILKFLDLLIHVSTI